MSDESKREQEKYENWKDNLGYIHRRKDDTNKQNK